MVTQNALTARARPSRSTVVGRAIERIRRVFERNDPPPEKQVECLQCGSTEFMVGPSNAVVYNLKCKACGTYHLYVPATGTLRTIMPRHRW